jgi:hypothetical protein
MIGLKKIKMEAFAVFMLLLSLYLLLFNGVTSTDDEQLYIALSESMATGRGYSALPLLGNDRIQGSTGSVEPLNSILGIPLFLIASYLKLGKSQMLFILPAVYTAATASLIYLILAQRGYSARTATFSAFGYGLGTIAFAYARMNFREPLAAFALTLALYIAEKPITEKDGVYRQILSVFLLLLTLGAALLTKITTAFILPVFLIIFLFKNKTLFTRLLAQRKCLLVGLPVIVVMLIAMLIKVFPAGSLSRFTLRFADYIIFTLPRLPHDHFWQAIAGLLFSPGKGLFVYSPILILMCVSPLMTRQSKSLVGMVPLLILCITQALIYNDEWWSITWGTRALLPAIPLLIVSAASSVERIWHHQFRWMRIPLYGLLIISMLAQAARLFASDPTYIAWATQTAGRSIDAAMQWDATFAPLFRHVWLGLHQPLSDIVWFHVAEVNTLALIIFFGAILFTMATGIWILAGKKHADRLVFISAIFVMTAVVALLFIAQLDDRYHGNAQSIGDIRDKVCDLANENDLILIDHYLHPFWWYYSNFGCIEPTWAGLPYPHQTAIHADLFYPRFSDVEQLAAKWLPTGNVYLISTTTTEMISYQMSFFERGFDLIEIAADEQDRFSVIEIIKDSW